MTKGVCKDESLVPVENVHGRRFDDELVILDLPGGSYYALNAVGAFVWEGLGAGGTPAQVAESLTARYQVDFERAVNDCVALADELVARGLLRRKT
jgi:Coenzyme PQQ synthesis protein D (PqqD)